MSVYKKLKEDALQQNATKIVTETTVPEDLRHIPESWDHHYAVSPATAEKIHNTFSGGDHVHFPLENNGHDHIDPDVAEHLTHHGWDVKDYKKGIATKEITTGNESLGIPLRRKMVEKSIGGILKDTNAHPDVQKAFMNDDARKSTRSFSNTGGHHVVISTSPMALAGASTGTDWTSCMNLHDGQNRSYLRNDSENGSHIAYLVHHDDHEGLKHGTPSKPIARILLKPFHSEDGDTIFRPETNVHGSGGTAFHNAVSNWANKNYPAKVGSVYTKNPEVYDDDNNTEYRALTKPEVERHIESGLDLPKGIGHSEISHALAYTHTKLDALTENPDSSPYTKHHYLDSIDHISKQDGLTSSHVAKIRGIIKQHADRHTSGFMLNTLAYKHGDKFSSAALNEHIAKNPTQIGNRALMNTKLSPEHVDSLSSDDLGYVLKSKIKPHHVDKIVNDYASEKRDANVTHSLSRVNDMLTSDHLHQIIGQTKTGVVGIKIPTIHSGDVKRIIDHPKFDKSHHDALASVIDVQKSLSVGHAETNLEALFSKSKFAKLSDIEPHVNRRPGTDPVHQHLANNPNLSKEDAVELKNRYVEHVGLSRQLTRLGSIPKRISDHMTKDDFHTIGASNHALNFEDPVASNKHLDAIQHHIEKTHSELEEHFDTHDFENDEHEGDLRANHLEEKLGKHISSLADNVDNHIDKHVADDDDDLISNHREHEKTVDRINDVQNLSKYSQDEDYHGDVEDVERRLRRLQRNTDRHNGY